MKKSLSVVLSSALVLSMFGAVAANADEMTAQQKFDALKDKGIFAGVNANGDAGLDQNMTRAEFARIAGLLDGLNVDATPTSQSFKDVAPGNWAYEEVEAAAKAGLIQGYGNGIYNPKGNVKVEDMAIVLDKILGLKVDDSATVDGADAYAQKYVKAAIDAGIISADANFKAAATRDQLVTSSYSTYEQANVASLAITASATAANQLTVNFNQAVDTSKATVTVWNGSNQVNSKAVTFADDKKSATIDFANNLAAADYTVKVEGLSDSALTAKVTVEAQKVAKIEFTSDKAALVRGNSQKVTVGYKVLDQYGTDITSTQSVTPTAGKGNAVIDMSSGTITMTSTADYTLGEQFAISLVNTTGAFASETVTVSPVAKVASINITKLYQPDSKDLQVGQDPTTYHLIIDAKDQYGNSVTDTTYLDSTTDSNDVITTVSNPAAVSLQGYNSAKSIATYNYGDIDGDGVKELYLTLDYNDPSAADKALTKGTSTVSIISSSTGAKATYDLNVKDAVNVDTFTMSAPSQVVAGDTVTIPYTAVDEFGQAIANPTDDMVTSMSATNVGKDSSGNDIKPTFVKDYTTGKTDLKLNLANVANGSTVVVTVITKTNKVQQITLTASAAKVPTVVSGVKDFDKGILLNNAVTIGTGNVTFKDQYGNDITPDFQAAGAADTLNKYRIAIASSTTSNISQSGDYIYANVTDASGNVTTSGAVTLKGIKAGSSSITLKLQKYSDEGTTTTSDDKWEDVANSSYVFSEKAVDKSDIQSYDASVAGTVYQTTTDSNYFQALNVKGTLANGDTVAIPETVTTSDSTPVTIKNFDVTSTNANLVYDDATGKFHLASGYDFGTNTTADLTAVVALYEANGAQEAKPVTVHVSNAAPATDSLSIVSDGTLTVSGNVVSATATVLNGTAYNTADKLAAVVVKAVDQYGVELTGATEPHYSVFPATVYDKTGAAVTTRGIGSLQTGDTVNVTVVTPNGKPITFKVVAN